MEIETESLVKADSIKIASIEVTDFARSIGEFHNIYVIKSFWLAQPTKLILRSYYQLWEYQCLLEKHLKNTPVLKEVLPPLPVVEDTDHMSIIEQYLMSLVLMVRNGSSMSAMIKNLFLPWESDKDIKQQYLSNSSKSPTKSDREVVGLKDWFKVVGNFSSDDTQLLNVYEGDLIQNLGCLQQGWCFCKREQELGKLPQAILSPCTLTLKEIETELIRLLEIRELKSVTGPKYVLPSQQLPLPECEYVEMNPLTPGANTPPRKPPPFRPSLDTHYATSDNTTGISSHPTSPKRTPTSSTSDDSKVDSGIRPSQGSNKYVINSLEDTLTEDNQHLVHIPPVAKTRLALQKQRSHSMHINKKSPSPIDKKDKSFGKTEARVSKIDYYAKSSLRTWEAVKRAQLQDQTINLTCVIHKEKVRHDCPLCARSQWMTAGNNSDDIYQCIVSHEPSLPTQLPVKQGDLVKVVKKNANGWWDVSPVDNEDKDIIIKLPATKLSSEPQSPYSFSKAFPLRRRNTSMEALEHDYYELTDGVEQKISTKESVSSVPTDPSVPEPYLVPILNAKPPPTLPPPRFDSGLNLPANELSLAKTANLKPLKISSNDSESNKSKTLSPTGSNQTPPQNSEKTSHFFLQESSIYQSTKLKKDFEPSEKINLLSRFSTRTNNNIDNSKKRNTFVSYLPEDHKENIAAPKAKLERLNSKKNFSKEEKVVWSTLGRQSGFFGSLSKERADEMLKQNAINGEYLIRASSTKEDSFVLCVYHGTSVHRYLIKFTDGRFVTGEPPMSFTDFSAIVSYYKLNALEMTADKEKILLKQAVLMVRSSK